MSYLGNQRNADRVAWADFQSAGNLACEVDRLLLDGDVPGSLRTFCLGWLDYLQERGSDAAQALCSRFPMSELLSNPEASAAVWLIYSVPPEKRVPGPFALRVLNTRESELNSFDIRTRLSVRTAQILIQLNSGDVESARSTVERMRSELRQDLNRNFVAIQDLHVEFLLACARVALCEGKLRPSARLYREALSEAENACLPLSTYRALCGLAIVLAHNGEFANGQNVIERAMLIGSQGGLSESKAAAELLWAQCILWGGRDDYDKVTAAMETAQSLAGSNDAWMSLAKLLNADALFRRGHWAAAAGILWSTVTSIAETHDAPLWRQTAAWLLGLVLVASNQPAEALRVISAESLNHAHMPCLAAVEGLAKSAGGDPAAAIEVTQGCLALGSEHANLSLIYVYIARAAAFEKLGLTTEAENVFLAALGIADAAKMHLSLEAVAGRQLADVSRRARARAPLLASNGLDFGQWDSSEFLDRMHAPSNLTAREREVLRLLSGPQTLAGIATSLFISENTVKTHARNLYRKLGVASRREATNLWASWEPKPQQDSATPPGN